VLVEGAAVEARAAGPEDAAAIASIYAPYIEDSFASFEEVAPDAVEMARRMQGAPRLPWLVASRGEEIVGYAYGSPYRARRAYRWAVECSVYLDAAWQGRGLGAMLYRRLLDELRSLGYVTAFAAIALPNEPSVRLHESLGFTSIGTFRSVGYKQGEWRDVGWWQLPLTVEPAHPAEPRAWEPG
jgi:L-amino acid N-acyltransferase YncA